MPFSPPAVPLGFAVLLLAAAGRSLPVRRVSAADVPVPPSLPGPASRRYFPLPSALGRGLLSAAVFRAAERKAGAGELREPLEEQLELKSVTFWVLASTLAAEQAATGDAGLQRGDVPRVGPAASLGLRRAKGGKKRRRGHCEDVALEVTLPPRHGK